MHIYIAYTAVGIILLHPALIVLPRYLEGGIRPWDAFVTMITDLGNLGVVLGLIAWVLLLILSAEMKLRAALMRTESRCSHYRLDYPDLDDENWRAWINIYQGDDGAM
ncbi:hypothetical protein [Yoonia sp.]|uniref:hypothetical protein n=1 Tax=Yoonia sp. TaxID=2212373 RepID=UPI00358FE29D